jgi:hypothetical protein
MRTIFTAGFLVLMWSASAFAAQNLTDSQFPTLSVPTVNVNDSIDASQNVNSKNRYVVLKDYTQQYVKAEAFITGKGRNSP